MNGIIYIAFGKRYVDEAIFSARSAKAFTSLPICIFSDIKTGEDCFDEEIIISPEHKRAKVDFLSRSPYERTLYLDSDTEIKSDITDVFDILDRFDIAAAQDHCRKTSRWSLKIPAYAAVPYAFPEYNGGVILYRKGPALSAFLDEWRRCFYENRENTNGQDQASFRISLWNSDLKLHTLPAEFNIRNERLRLSLFDKAKEPGNETLLKPRIFHWHRLNEKPGFFSKFKNRHRPMKY
ncbi:hypothetical protein [Neorhizobium sp. NCHU2750]|uniref:hypothetical protein n=1 Tax=Neorhizobium sp. NCHU2750 TaxID=1825976 RepID=UPI000E714D53|nr:hypothetical protein NCHU2750_22460 [Neorhizobium sp. NCHU2750]